MPYAIDLFCGAGGFSEGILQAGFEIIFSSDKSPMAKETYTNRHTQLGIIEGIDTHFELADIKELTSEVIFNTINNLKYGKIFQKGSVDVIFGGPPCQGFSRLGKRDINDPRNMLFHEYLRIIRDVQPKYVVMENVTGILDMQMLDFPSVLNTNDTYKGQNLVKTILQKELNGLGYSLLDVQTLNAADYGIPQQRNRVVFLAYRNDVTPINYPTKKNKTITVYDALGDLYSTDNYYSSEYSRSSIQGRTPQVNNNSPIMCTTLTNMETSKHEKSVVERFSLYNFGENKQKAINRLNTTGINLKDTSPTLFYESLFLLNNSSNNKAIFSTLDELNLMKEKFTKDKWLHNTNIQLSLLFQSKENSNDYDKLIKSLSLRLLTSTDFTIEFWNRIKANLNQEITEQEYHQKLLEGSINKAISEAIFTKKGIRTRLNPNTISPTMVTLPDDFIHPYFDRVLTVREMARLQSFDDSFEFLGKRTTGGSKRALETPQFTQVGNAVPPLLAKAIATEIYQVLILKEE